MALSFLMEGTDLSLSSGCGGSICGDHLVIFSRLGVCAGAAAVRFRVGVLVVTMIPDYG